mgnify:CR=1 FL=1
MSKQSYYERKPQNNSDVLVLKKERAMRLFAYEDDISDATIARRLCVSTNTLAMWRKEFDNKCIE